MGETNFSTLSGNLSAASVARGVSAGFTVPNGGSSYVFGYNSLDTSAGAVGYYCNETDFSPLVDDAAAASGGSIRGAIKRGTSGGPTDFAPFFFIGLQAADTTSTAYMLGLSDNSPYEILLAKTTPENGLDPSASTVLRASTATYSPDTWHHLRLDMIVNPNGDVVLNVFESDLSTYAVTSPTWAAITGMASFIDDALGVNSETVPITGGYVGFGFQTGNVQRRGYFDHIEIFRQK